MPLWTGPRLAYSTVQKTGAAAVQGAVPVPGHLGPARPGVRRLGFRSLFVGHRLDARVRRRQLRAGRRTLSQDRPPQRQRAGDADGRRLRQGLWLVAEERLAVTFSGSPLAQVLAMGFAATLGGTRYVFPDLRVLLAKATPRRAGDVLAEIAASDATERVAAQMALADLPLSRFLDETPIPYEQDEVTRLIIDSHDRVAFAAVASLTVGEFRDWLLSERADVDDLTRLAPGLTPEMVAAASKIMRLQDLITVAGKCRVVTRFRNTIGLPGSLSTRLQPNHPTDDLHGIAASILDGLMLASGDAVIGINPATDSLDKYIELTRFLDRLRERLGFP